MKRCPFDAAPINRETATMWRCSSCGMPFHAKLYLDRRLWSGFRKYAKLRLAVLRDEGGMSDEEIRPGLGVVFKIAILDAQDAIGARA